MRTKSDALLESPRMTKANRKRIEAKLPALTSILVPLDFLAGIARGDRVCLGAGRAFRRATALRSRLRFRLSAPDAGRYADCVSRARPGATRQTPPTKHRRKIRARACGESSMSPTRSLC